MKENLIQKRSLSYALSIVKLYKALKAQHEYEFARQLLKSSTSIGANIEESIAAQSRADFVSKLSIALKEAQESRYWLIVLDESHLIHYNYDTYLQDIDEIIRILASIVKTTKQTK